MSHSKFGWSYPPGCSGPDDNMPADSALVEELAGTLEDAGMPEDKVDAILDIVRAWEEDKENKLNRLLDESEPEPSVEVDDPTALLPPENPETSGQQEPTEDPCRDYDRGSL